MPAHSVRRAILLTLTDQPHHVDWPAFSPPDWDLLLTTAQAEAVAPLLCHALETAGWPAQMPAHLRQELRASYYATAAHNLVIYQQLARILAALPLTVSPPLPVILLKGVVLAATVYPNIALRPLADLDLLVPRQHMEAAVQAVQALGYQEAYPEMIPGLGWPAGYHTHLRGGPQNSVSVELHWGLIAGDADWRSPPIDWFWEQTEKWKGIGEKGNKGIREQGDKGVREQGNSTFELFPLSTYSLTPSFVLQLTPTAHLLYLAAHLMLQHGGAQARLLWFYDLHLLITRCADRLDWDELLRRAREFRWAAALHAALGRAQECFDTPLPHGFLDALARSDDLHAVRFVQRKADLSQTRATSVWDALMSLDWRTRLRLAWGIACPSPAYMRWRYQPRPTWLWPLYYPYRWFDILRDGLTTLWCVVIGRRQVRGSKHQSL